MIAGGDSPIAAHPNRAVTPLSFAYGVPEREPSLRQDPQEIVTKRLTVHIQTIPMGPMGPLPRLPSPGAVSCKKHPPRQHRYMLHPRNISAPFSRPSLLCLPSSAGPSPAHPPLPRKNQRAPPAPFALPERRTTGRLGGRPAKTRSSGRAGSERSRLWARERFGCAPEGSFFPSLRIPSQNSRRASLLARTTEEKSDPHRGQRGEERLARQPGQRARPKATAQLSR